MQMQMDGIRTEFPEYYGQVLEAIRLCFVQVNRTTGNLTAIVRFEILRDGRVRSIRPYRRSGNGVFDVNAVESVECAGRGRIGPLPPEIPVDILPFELTFRPL